MRTFHATALAVLAVPAVRADEAYVIKLKLDVEKGLTMTYHSLVKGSKELNVSNAGPKDLAETIKSEDETIYKQTALECDSSGYPTVWVRVYEKATSNENGKAAVASYQGRTVLFAKIDGKFRVGVMGEPQLDPKDVSKLLKGARAKSDPEAVYRGLMTGKPVRVGDSWSIPAKPVAATFADIVIDEGRSSVVAKLAKVYAKGTSTFGTFEVTTKLLYTSMSEDGAFIKYDPPGILDATLRVDMAIDGTSSERSEAGTFETKGEGRWQVGGKEVRLATAAKLEGSTELSAAVDDATARVRPKVTFLADPEEWVEVKSKDGSFTIHFPESPTAITSRGKKTTTTRWTAGTHHGKRIYEASVAEFDDPASIKPAALQKAVLASNKGARDIKEIKVGEFSGTEWRFDQEQPGVTYEVIRRVFITKQRAFELRVVAPKGSPAEAEKFFKSFEILVKP
jgi:hypothetical protein